MKWRNSEMELEGSQDVGMVENADMRPHNPLGDWLMRMQEQQWQHAAEQQQLVTKLAEQQ